MRERAQELDQKHHGAVTRMVQRQLDHLDLELPTPASDLAGINVARDCGTPA